MNELDGHVRRTADQYGVALDDKRYYDPENGTIAVDPERWLAAQERERWTWFDHCPNISDDRSGEHAAGFDNYSALPEKLGDVIEVGCGPFTQLRSIITGRSTDRIVLSDPLLTTYLNHPHCSYRHGILCGRSVETWPQALEDIDSTETFDLAVCTNVLEHVRDAPVFLDNLFHLLRLHGLLVFGERVHDNFDPSLIFDLPHPIKVKRRFLERFFGRFFKTVYRAERDSQSSMPGQSTAAIYFIGLKL